MMSINVTVHGNPISVKKGRMVTYMQDEEFECRRKIRLQQVRQQSKEIAANIRNRVKKVKSQQLEKHVEDDLKQYKQRKINQIQKQINETENHVGEAHEYASKEKDPNEVLSELRITNLNKSKIRGKAAESLDQNKKQIRNIEENKCKKLKKINNECESIRSTMISNLNKNSKANKKPLKKRKIINKTKSDEDNFISDIENKKSKTTRSPGGSDKTLKTVRKKSPSKKCEESCSSFEESNFVENSPNKNVNRLESSEEEVEVLHNYLLEDEKEKSQIPQPTEVPKYDELISHNLDCTSDESRTDLTQNKIKKIIDNHRPLESCFTTKISDRIRQRQLQKTLASKENLQSFCDYCKEHLTHSKNIIECPHLCETKKIDYSPLKEFPNVIKSPVKSPTKYKNNTPPRRQITSSREISPIKKNSQAKSKPFRIETHKVIDIPSKKMPFIPQTIIDDSAFTSQPIIQQNKAKCYDNIKHIRTEYQPKTIVQKINKDDIRFSSEDPNVEQEEYRKKCDFYKKKAQIRGQKALEKTKVQQDYKKLLSELPTLLKQEGFAQIPKHKPEFHMADERLQDFEKRRQNRIENMFEKYYYKSQNLETPLITLDPQTEPTSSEQNDVPYKSVDVTDEPQTNEWKCLFNPSSKQIEEEEKMELDKKQKTLKELLERVNKQRELLLQEVATLPATSNLQNLLQDEELIKLTNTDSCPCKSKKLTTTATSPVTTIPIRKISIRSKKRGMRKRLSTNSSSDNSTDDSTRISKKTTKKAKITPKNVETQTSPYTVTKKSPKPETATSGETERDKLCRIIINVPDDPHIKISAKTIPPKNYTKEILEKRARSPNHSTSTTYLSPPELKAKMQSLEGNRRTKYKDLLHSKPQQTNIKLCTCGAKDGNKIKNQRLCKCTGHGTELSVDLLSYIKQLLYMSRQSIDELTISTVSDVSTPSTSVLETRDNSTLQQLQNILNHCNISLNDLKNHLNISDTESIEQESFSKESPVENQLLKQESQSPQNIQEKPTEENQFNDIISKYRELTQNCCEKISTLTSMIDNVRLEKQRLLSPLSTSDKDMTFTSYLELPSELNENIGCTCTTKEKSAPEIPVKLCKFCRSKKITETDSAAKPTTSSPNSGSSSSSNTSASQSEVDRYLLSLSPPNEKKNQEQDFVPMLDGIPRYSNDRTVQPLEILGSTLNQFLLSKKNKPPPSLVRNLQKYNLNIDMTPHELSTIIELDTTSTSRLVAANNSKILTTKPSNEEITTRQSDSSGSFNTISPERLESPISLSISKSADSSQNESLNLKILQESKQLNLSSEKRKSSSPSKNVKSAGSKKGDLKSPTKSKKNKNLKIVKTPEVQQLSPDLSTSSPEDMEAILRNMGLGWAVTTLKKTQKALALSSSSTSLETSYPKRKTIKENTSSSSSDVSLKEVLLREHAKKLQGKSSSSSQSFHEANEMSLIIGGSLTQSRNKSQQRTSTPNQKSKSPQKDSSNNLFTGESDVSSVRQISGDDNFFLSIPNVTLDTNRSLSRK